MAEKPKSDFAALCAWLAQRGIRAHCPQPSGLGVESLGLGFRIAAVSAESPLTLELDAPPEGILSLGHASWKEAGWVEIPDSGTLTIPTPAAVLLSDVALAIAGERRWTALELRVERGGSRISIDVPTSTEGACWLAHGDSVDALSAVAADMMRDVPTAGPPRGPLLGWMSWDELRFGLSEGDVVENAVVLAERLGPDGAIALIDDGWQRAAGDWEPHEPFAHGMLWLTDRLHRLGLRAGLWIAPFIAALRSPLGKEHREWLLRGDDGEPLVELDNAHWGGKCGTLDPTRPEVRDWLRALGARVREWEFDYLKMDFLAHALTGHAHDESRPRAEVYREAISAIQAGLGSDIMTMGCGTPLVPGRGLFDAVRIDDDVVTDWNLLRSRLSSVSARSPLHRLWWRSDPDNVLLREPFTVDQARAWASVVAITGGSLFLGDDLRRLTEERWEIARAIWPPVDVVSKPIGLMTPHPPAQRPAGDGWVARVTPPWGMSWITAFLNWASEPRDHWVTWAELGLDSLTRCHVWEFWSGRYRGIAAEELQSRVAGQSCEVLAITPVEDHPQIVGSTRHVLAGAVGLAEVKWDSASATLSGRIAQHWPSGVCRTVVAAPSPWSRAHATGIAIEDTSVTDEHTLFTLCAERDGLWSLRFE